MRITNIFDNVEDWFKDRVDDAANAVQSFTGEKERR